MIWSGAEALATKHLQAVAGTNELALARGLVASDDVAFHLRDHQMATQDWTYWSLVLELHRWTAIFDKEFSLNLPSYPVLKIAPLRGAYATYAWFRSEMGTKDNITFNSNELTREPALILRTHLHELLHLVQHYFGEPGKGNYHNEEYRRRALECGLVVDARGCTSGHTEVFTQVLTKHGVQLDPLPPEPVLWGARRRNVKMKKWSCSCTNVRCATLLKATCVKCGQRFVLS